MGYVQYPAIKPPNISSMNSPLHKVCAGTTHNPKSQTDIKNKHAQMDIKNKHGTTHNPKSQMDIKSTAAKMDIKSKHDTTHNPKPQMDIKSKHSQKIKPSAVTQEKQSRQRDEPRLPKIKWNKDSTELNDKVHKLSITKDYILREFTDVFKGINTLPGGPYHIRLKDDYKPVQHPPRSVPIAMHPAYKAELDKLKKASSQKYMNTQNGSTL